MKKLILLVLLELFSSLAFGYTYLPCPHRITGINVPCYISKPGVYNITGNIYFSPTSCFLNNSPLIKCPFILINSSNIIINGNFHEISLKNIAMGFVLINKTNITIKNIIFIYSTESPFIIKNSKNVTIANTTISFKNITNTGIECRNSSVLIQNLVVKNVNYPILLLNSSFLIFNSSFKYYQTAIHVVNAHGTIYKSNITNGIIGILLNNSFAEIFNTYLTNNSNGIIINNSKLIMEDSYICKNIYDILLLNKTKGIQLRNCTIGYIFLVKNNTSIKLNKTQLRKILGWDFYANEYCGMENHNNRTKLKIEPVSMNPRIVINKKYRENKDLIKDVFVIIFIIIVVIIALYFMIFKKI